ncbi:tRNA (adenosine(37)-N6)-threonylcarbamoyltransferase complex dimerization subunit type 1 TsaB [Paenibacillus flagellatus]|uniref:tRNA (Adenosine(37)-N6)-threonylcarbamoyltransferase complex dimerization subunit type 1 TsaB n=1 Tax=Paenibacillus flagellatus TaxID=2211139 RepID=A0A2V5K5F7_9BACL|nr:tRNA (adenosine(37)-N6)-threonylcarbamoyltransferase complex dimerization subunit type 1 TsaB [Paenibacillus flagellatus]PYI52913.1 tRNA (adenosine(37)-N6)-threonylcarbamoyltransferase complex dimerization subunit type 1 TsaB [Paenibacillus flagellatus]
MTTEQRETNEERNARTGRLLAIDTSTAALTVALASGGRIVAERSSRAERNHSIKLLPEIEAMLKEAGVAPSDLDAVAVGTGPGSYTGVRIGVTVAKTFAWSLGIPVVGVSGLEALALGDAERNATEGADTSASRWFVPLLDARRGQAFCGVYASERDGWRTIEPDGIRLAADWLEELSAKAESGRRDGRGPDRIAFVGETAGFGDTIRAWLARHPELAGAADVREGEIRAAQIAELAWRRLDRGEHDDPHGIVPNYTQLAEAEVKLLQKEQRGGEPFGAC